MVCISVEDEDYDNEERDATITLTGLPELIVCLHEYCRTAISSMSNDIPPEHWSGQCFFEDCALIPLDIDSEEWDEVLQKGK